jgi:hypothetical protein
VPLWQFICPNLAWLDLGVIAHAIHPAFARATGATIEGTVCFNAVPDDFAPAVIADRRELVNRALKAIKRVANARRDDLEGEVVFIPADLTLRHRTLLSHKRSRYTRGERLLLARLPSK